MKNLIKISFGIFAGSLFFLNVNLLTNNDKVEALNLNADAKVALADGGCHYSTMYSSCYCITSGTTCIAFCSNFCAGAIVEGK